MKRAATFAVAAAIACAPAAAEAACLEVAGKFDIGPLKRLKLAYETAWAGSDEASLAGLRNATSRRFERAGGSLANIDDRPGRDREKQDEGLVSYIKAMRSLWANDTLTIDLDGATCEYNERGVVSRAVVPWSIEGDVLDVKGDLYAEDVRITGVSNVAFDFSGRMDRESVTVDDTAVTGALAERQVEEPAEPTIGSELGDLWGWVKINGNYVPNGTEVTCIDGSSGPNYVSDETAGGYYDCDDLVAGQVTLQANGQSAGPCPNHVVNGVNTQCNATITGCANPSVSFSSLLIPLAPILPLGTRRFRAKRRTRA